MATTTLASKNLVPQWWQQIGGRCRWRSHRGPRQLAALTYFTYGRPNDGLIDVRRVVFCVYHDAQEPAGALRHRLAGYQASLMPWGLMIGGAQQIRFEKDLALAPGQSYTRYRWSHQDPNLLGLGLQLDRWLERHARHPFFPRHARPRWPRFWATLEGQSVTGQGPEFEAYCREFDCSPQQALIHCRRVRRGRLLYPLEFVSHLWQSFRAVHVDLGTFPARRVIQLDCPDNLVGFQGACRYDLLHSRPCSLSA